MEIASRFTAALNKAMVEVNTQVYLERLRQNEKWGRQNQGYGGWLAILVEEVGELAHTMQ
ncbi:hypothetical protein OR571_18360 [Psychrobacillus sp. NEAU-3TGS]|uniref:hypothetical protein n=1 Tax=Psychrobacillus sp. NEAU-3TGS TaxID=2995412 RepID=UPI0024978B11|nr:hypothetical protein [Psychrobacillus sp. NEAU-3TGS]MDI2589003.1 hypothetical protein [Psychrobacillus sp. NEAU-3TGS]